jgi:DNA-binding GntR family transcriptional regulator
MVVARVERPSLTDLAYQSLVEAIYDRTFPPGSPVNIDRLAAALGISVTPVREALVRAASVGLLTRESNKGFRVAPLLTSTEYHHLFEVRRLLELCAVASARPTSAQIERLTESLRRMQASGDGPAYQDYAAFSTADREFHVALVSISDNTFAIEAWTNLHHHLHIGRLYAGRGVVDAREAIEEHAAIVEAARAGDHEALLSATRSHIVVAEQRLVTLLADADASFG